MHGTRAIARRAATSRHIGAASWARMIETRPSPRPRRAACARSAPRASPPERPATTTPAAPPATAIVELGECAGRGLRGRETRRARRVRRMGDQAGVKTSCRDWVEQGTPAARTALFHVSKRALALCSFLAALCANGRFGAGNESLDGVESSGGASPMARASGSCARTAARYSGMAPGRRSRRRRGVVDGRRVAAAHGPVSASGKPSASTFSATLRSSGPSIFGAICAGTPDFASSSAPTAASAAAPLATSPAAAW